MHLFGFTSPKNLESRLNTSNDSIAERHKRTGGNKSTNEIVYRENARGVNWKDLADVYKRAPLGKLDAGKLRRAYASSEVCCFAFSGEALVGGGRVISDGEAPATVCELVVAPEYQRQGVGRAILRAILRKLAVPKVILACVHGQQDFYRREGFLSHKSVMALYANTQWFVDNANLEPGDAANGAVAYSD
ncbi:MAG: GNAT family N-acetyltransferase [Candidatus Latescibacteria bacterium]|nr:GNAT family N-acetyltransferase [Candidatus Latescibacterota bacterium]